MDLVQILALPRGQGQVFQFLGLFYDVKEGNSSSYYLHQTSDTPFPTFPSPKSAPLQAQKNHPSPH